LEGNLMFIETDVLLVEGKHSEPIMAHPPATDSDLTFDEMLRVALPTGKGLKIDFKSMAAVEPSLKILKSYQAKVQFCAYIPQNQSQNFLFFPKFQTRSSARYF
jgi:hypothetical protein